MEPLIVVAFIVLAAGGIWLSWYLKKKRQQAWALAASKLGLAYSPHDIFGLERLPFELMSRGDGRGVENVAHGTFMGAEVKIFEYWYYDEHESTDSKGNRTTSRDYEHFTCALLRLPHTCPHLRVSREGVLSRLADAVGFRDIELESEEFNRRYQVKCDDKRFAVYTLDARMMEYLLANDGYAYELNAGQLLASCRRQDPEKMAGPAIAAKAFSDRIPDVVWETYRA